VVEADRVLLLLLLLVNLLQLLLIHHFLLELLRLSEGHLEASGIMLAWYRLKKHKPNIVVPTHLRMIDFSTDDESLSTHRRRISTKKREAAVCS